MKNIILGITVVIVVGVGGFIAYDKLNKEPLNNDTNIAETSTGTNQETAEGTLELDGKGLTEVGPDIYNKTDTVVLILTNNKLKSLKSEMGKMTKLEILNLNYNQLEGTLIAEIRNMPLKELHAGYNNLTGIPAEIGQLSKLETLDISHNKISSYPNEIEKISQLKFLNLTGNPISPEKIEEIKAKLPNTTVVF